MSMSRAERRKQQQSRARENTPKGQRLVTQSEKDFNAANPELKELTAPKPAHAPRHTTPAAMPNKPANPALTQPVLSPTKAAGRHRPPVRFSSKAKIIAGGTLVGIGAAGGTLAYRQGKKNGQTVMAKNLVNPFEEVVVFGKAYQAVYPFSAPQSIGALHATGAHVGHGNKLTIVRGKATSPQGSGLRRYTTTPTGQKSGPFGKSEGLSIPRSLRRAVNSNIPDGSRRGQRI